MKTCPSCQAQIEDDARFCLYCMTSLDNKETVGSTAKRSKQPFIWLSASAVLCIIVAVTAGILLTKNTPVDPLTITTAVTTVTTPSTHRTVSATDITTTTAVEQAPAVTYVYRPVESGDEFIAVGIERPENGITIVDVETPAEDGVYDIPAYIDGCPVLAIEEYAFCRSAVAPTVKTVYFPTTMSTVNEFAFASCVNLSDVYYRGNIYIQGYAYPDKDKRTGALTIHCAEDCHNRNFRLHKNMVSEEDNTYYEEWNGD